MEFALKHEQDLFEKLHLESKQDHEIVEQLKKEIPNCDTKSESWAPSKREVKFLLQKILERKE